MSAAPGKSKFIRDEIPARDLNSAERGCCGFRENTGASRFRVASQLRRLLQKEAPVGAANWGRHFLGRQAAGMRPAYATCDHKD